MPVLFNAKYLLDREIWARLDALLAQRDRARELLARPEISTDPGRVPELARELEHLNRICRPAEDLKGLLDDMQQLEEMLQQEAGGEENELSGLYEEYSGLCTGKAREIYHLLLENGYLEEEIEDETDHDILKFIEYAGPEYAWRLGINLGLDEAEARHRLEVLLAKGLLKRVEGTLLHNYHRQKDWSKHMNHTYYRLSRRAKLYLRELRRNGE